MPGLSIIIPASNEAAFIGRCLASVLASNPAPTAGSGSIPLPMPVEIIVVANGCRDKTAEIARGYHEKFAARGWGFLVIERGVGGKMGALNAGDASARYGARVYLDADVVVSPPLLHQLARALASGRAVYASGRVEISPPRTWISRAYGRVYARVPFMSLGVAGCGLFAVNAMGRRRWGEFPDIISDDTFVRLSFAPSERIGVFASYQWPIVEGFSNLVKVRKRQDIGVREIGEKFPELLDNNDKYAYGMVRKLMIAVRNPVGFLIYVGVAVATRFGKDSDDWSRGR